MNNKFSLIVFRNSNNEFLLKYDEGWGCWLLPYYKGSLFNLHNDFKSLIINKIDKYKTYNITKYSYNSKIIKTYIHNIFIVDSNIEKIVNLDKKYKWFSITDMENDKEIKLKNYDVLNILKEMK